MLITLRRERPRAVWLEIVTHLETHCGTLWQQGRHSESLSVLNAMYQVSMMLDNPRWNGVAKLGPDTTRILDDAFASLCGVVEEPGGTALAAMIADAADDFVRDHQRGQHGQPRLNDT